MALIVAWLPLLYPTGTLPSPRWRVPAILIIAISTTSLIAAALRPGPIGEGGPLNPLGLPGWPNVLAPLADGLLAELCFVVAFGIAGLAARYRSGTMVERLQIRWLVAALSIVLLGFVGAAVEGAIRSDDGILVSAVLLYPGILAIPMAIGIAILRYRLYEIDRIISRTLSYAIVTATLAVVFVTGVLGLQALLSPVTQNDTLAVAVSTLIVAALFQPLRSRVKRVVDRRFDRTRYDGQRTAEAFARELRDEVDLDAIEDDLRAVITRSLGPRSSFIWVRRRDASVTDPAIGSSS
jgi:hypothetical protein